MTVVLAAVCRDGVVLGSDSQITDKGRGMTYPAEKLHPLGDLAAWGGSGARSVLTDVERCFNENSAAILEAPDIGHALQERVLPILRHHYDTFIPDVPGDEGGGTPAAYVMAAGWRGGEPWILEITPSGMIGHYADIGFHAIGSGAPMAQQAGSLLSHFHLAERSLRFGCAAVLRVLQALDLTSASVGKPFSLCRIDEQGAHHLSQEEIEEVSQVVRRWEEAEQAVIADIFD
ncbi:MAG: proteasome protein [Alphaproteobacteria bacterium]|nr:proteasome protein [Alphaproteobacteria bacterium]MBU0805401.1 proteasome protein [Alphaproteobacteria bacterium]MBU0873347.1 proteasome protein [Alphaproteobacteria bacterium]MBU1401425.1 proteasome protein [Alphaproteobacteria bacterium]MBU1592158.1 proteasome protein [Alphaproteobacteria bacterium]